MKREIDLSEISDGRLYTSNDMVKIGCNDCAGCSECCRMVGDTILLDPYDVFWLEQGLKARFEELMASYLDLRVVDGLIQPHLRMRPEEGCVFLNREGRCAIHGYRPGFCRMFPMGRIYQEQGFRYFLQVHECPYPNKTKVKLRKWLGIPALESYEQYIRDWHMFVKELVMIVEGIENQEIVKNLNMYVLNQFYVNQYDVEKDFYPQFYTRLSEAKPAAAMYR